MPITIQVLSHCRVSMVEVLQWYSRLEQPLYQADRWQQLPHWAVGTIADQVGCLFIRLSLLFCQGVGRSSLGTCSPHHWGPERLSAESHLYHVMALFTFDVDSQHVLWWSRPFSRGLIQSASLQYYRRHGLKARESNESRQQCDNLLFSNYFIAVGFLPLIVT